VLLIFILSLPRSNRLLGQDLLSEREMSLQTPVYYFNPDETLYSSTHRMFQGIPGIERAPGGRLWVSRFSGSTGEGSPKNYSMLITSGDDGKTWSDLKIVVDMPDNPVRVSAPCLWLDPLGRLWFFWKQAYVKRGNANLHCGLWAMVTGNPDDPDPIWSEPRRLCDGVMHNKPTILSNSDWLFPVNLKINWPDESWENKKEIPSNMVAMTTNDLGKTFIRHGSLNMAALDKHNPADRQRGSEAMLVELENGALWMLIRMRYGLGESYSRDGGRTWSAIVPSPIKNPASKFFLRKLSSGHLLLVKNGPIDMKTKRELLTAYISEDNGKTWKGGLILDERHPVSYPDGIQAPDGRIYVIYDHGRYPGTAREILMAVFTEADVLRGEPSEKTRLKVLINRALEPGCDQRVR
jgi:hypothetical protein